MDLHNFVIGYIIQLTNVVFENLIYNVAALLKKRNTCFGITASSYCMLELSYQFQTLHDDSHDDSYGSVRNQNIELESVATI